jgi:Icc-related predicted phosphoesterase
MKILSISDVLVPFIYTPQVKLRFADVDLVISCGDLPYYYQDYISTMLNVPLFFVRGNHDPKTEYGDKVNRSGPEGGIDLHRRVVYYRGLIIAGVEGSLRYRLGNYQYTQAEMWQHVWALLPALLRNRAVYGRYLDVFVTHAPPRDVHDQPDRVHQGVDAFRWLVRVFQPTYHFHGHIHLYRLDEETETLVGRTRVINTYGFRETVVPDYRQIKTGFRASRKT